MMYRNGRTIGTMPPQAQTNGIGRMPPQASTNGMGRFGAIGMMPPQAQAGVGDDMTPTGVPEGEPHAWRDGVFGGRRAPLEFGVQDRPYQDGVFSPPLGRVRGRLRGIGDDMMPTGVPEGEPHAWRDGVFGGRRQPLEFGVQDRPWEDGVFSPPLGLRGLRGEDSAPSGAPTIALEGSTLVELKLLLGYLNQNYIATPGDAYDLATEAAYRALADTFTADYPDPSVLYVVKDGKSYPSARGLYLLAHAARMKLATELGGGDAASFEQVAFRYPAIWAFALAFQGANYTGNVTVPGRLGGMKTSTVALMGAGAIGVGLFAAFALRPKQRKNGRRRRR